MENGEPVKRSQTVLKPQEKLTAGRVIVPILVACVIVAIALVYGVTQVRTLLSYADETVWQKANAAAAQVQLLNEYGLSSIRSAAISTSGIRSVNEAEQVEEIIQTILPATPFDSIEYVRVNGTNTANGGEAFDASDRTYYKEGIRGRTGILLNTDPEKSETDLLDYYTPILTGEWISGVLVGHIRTDEQIVPFLETDYFGETAYGLVVDSSGTVIASTADVTFAKNRQVTELLTLIGMTDAQAQEQAEQMGAATEGVSICTRTDGMTRVCTVPIEGTDWFTVVLVPAESVQTVQSKNTAPAIAAFGGLVAVLLIYLLFVVAFNRREKNRISYLAEHDALTNLFNRGTFESLLKLHAANEIRFALCVIDIDDFKSFNDSYGHEMGDRVLKTVADTLVNAFRTCDYVCRIGGDEFAVIMTDMDTDLKYVVLNKMNAIAAKLNDAGNGIPKVTLSCGVGFSSCASEEKGIFADADEALCRAKAAGKNGVFFSDRA